MIVNYTNEEELAEADKFGYLGKMDGQIWIYEIAGGQIIICSVFMAVHLSQLLWTSYNLENIIIKIFKTIKRKKH